jgi:hypothetical protein
MNEIERIGEQLTSRRGRALETIAVLMKARALTSLAQRGT